MKENSDEKIIDEVYQNNSIPIPVNSIHTVEKSICKISYEAFCNTIYKCIYFILKKLNLITIWDIIKKCDMFELDFS